MILGQLQTAQISVTRVYLRSFLCDKPAPVEERCVRELREKGMGKPSPYGEKCVVGSARCQRNGSR